MRKRDRVAVYDRIGRLGGKKPAVLRARGILGEIADMTPSAPVVTRTAQGAGISMWWDIAPEGEQGSSLSIRIANDGSASFTLIGVLPKVSQPGLLIRLLTLLGIYEIKQTQISRSRK